MYKFLLTFTAIFTFLCSNAQTKPIDKGAIKEDLEEILTDLSTSYSYFQEKQIDLACLRDYYSKQIDRIETEEQKVLFFEYLLDEFYDSHLILNTNTNSSYRLYAPVYARFQNDRLIVSQVWQTQINALPHNIVGAEIKMINGISFSKAIDDFPTHCSNKASAKVKEWIANKILAGRYNQPRLLTLQLSNGNTIELDLDSIKYKSSQRLLDAERQDGIGIIRINNSLGNNSLIEAFDKALDSLHNTKGLIIDLRNTVNGGNSYVARGLMGRFITTPMPYQKHWKKEKYDNGPAVERSWMEYVSPRGKPYKKPVVVLVGRWTGSMGEGLAIGFDGIRRAKIVGTEMERLAGEMNGFSFKHQKFGYRLSTAKLFHINGTPREEFVPHFYVAQSTNLKDEEYIKALELLR